MSLLQEIHTYGLYLNLLNFASAHIVFQGGMVLSSYLDLISLLLT
jgi:hypothetical protein